MDRRIEGSEQIRRKKDGQIMKTKQMEKTASHIYLLKDKIRFQIMRIEYAVQDLAETVSRMELLTDILSDQKKKGNK